MRHWVDLGSPTWWPSHNVLEPHLSYWLQGRPKGSFSSQGAELHKAAHGSLRNMVLEMAPGGRGGVQELECMGWW